MNIYPYVYRIDHPTGEFYIGYRAANTVPAEADLGHKYKTSSNHLSHPFEEYSQTILAEFYLPSGKADAYDFEQALIFEHWGNPFLVNKACHHGRGRFNNAGVKHSAETRQKISEANRGKVRKPVSDETRTKMSEARRGKPFLDETKRKISTALQGKTLSVEHKAKISLTLRGKTHSAETKAKISATMRGKTHSFSPVTRTV